MSAVDIVSSFIKGAPPGEVDAVVKSIKILTSDSDPATLSKAKQAYQQYNEEQLVCTKLPGSSEYTIISKYTRVPDSNSNEYYDPATSTSFTFDHQTSTASAAKSYQPDADSSNSTLLTSLQKSLSAYLKEHYPPTPAGSAATVTRDPSNPQNLALLISTTKSSPHNFLSGRWRAIYLLDTTNQSHTLTGTIQVQVHYYEEGNVALTTQKTLKPTPTDGTSKGILATIAKIEREYQEEMNRTLVDMNEGSFKGLRRQLPVTRQRIEWEKVRGYDLSNNLKGAR